MVVDKSETVKVHMPHRQTVKSEIILLYLEQNLQTFKYFENYRKKYVEGEVGASLERHNFCHTDRPDGHHTKNGHFILGKFLDSHETVLELTAFQVFLFY